MTQFGNGRETSRRTGHDETVTRTDSDVSARMAGTHPHDATDRTVSTDQHTVVRPGHDDSTAVRGLKTSAAAVFSLVFGLAALFCALTAILSPAAVLFGIIGLVLGVVGLKMAKRRGVTGKGVAVGGIVTALLGLLLGAAVLVGAAALVNDERRLDQLQSRLDDLRNDLPTGSEVRESVDPS